MFFSPRIYPTVTHFDGQTVTTLNVFQEDVMTEYAHARARDWRLDRPQQSRPPLQRWLTIWMKVVCAETLAMFTTLDSVYADPYIA